jgi:ribonuclease P protein component
VTLRSRGDFARLQAGGRSRADRLVTVRVMPNELGHDRYAISTGRRLGGAVQRNRVRRRIREILRHASRPPGGGLDILVVARPPCLEATFGELRSALLRLLDGIRRQSGVSVP